MTLSEDLAREKARVQEALIRTIVREEIVNAFKILERAADHEDGYGTGELKSAGLGAIVDAAQNAVRRLTCTHEFGRYGEDRCWTCQEPEPEPVNPFETKEETHGTS